MTHLYKKYFPNLDVDKLAKLVQFKEVFLEWNSKVNLISRKDTEFFELNHVLHSLSIAAFINFRAKTEILDFGTGGGFPGIPLAILFPDSNFTLIDSIAKKTFAVADMCNRLELKNTKVLTGRVEDVSAKFDFITCRAVGRLSEILNWVKGKLQETSLNERPNGFIFLKGGNLEAELAEIKLPHQVFHISDVFEESWFQAKEIVYLPQQLKKFKS